MKINLLILISLLLLFGCKSSEITTESFSYVPEIDLSTKNYVDLRDRKDGNEKHKEFLSALYSNLRIPQSINDEEINGKVVIEVFIDKEGNAYITKIINMLHPELAHSLISAIKKQSYKPYQINSEPVNVLTVFTVQFII